MGISQQQALDCLESDDLIGIGMEAVAVRRSLHPEAVVTYSLDQKLNLGALPAEASAAAHAVATFAASLTELGGTGLLFYGSSARGLAWLEALVSSLKREFPALSVQALTASQLQNLATDDSLQLSTLLARLKDAGLDAIGPGNMDCRSIAPWIAVHRAAHRAGLGSSAELLFGAGESSQQRVAALFALEALQAETGGFVAFRLRSFHEPGGRDLDDATAVEYLKTLAVCRMSLASVVNVEADWEQQGLKVLQMSLRFGANDCGSLLGTHANASEEEVRRIIRDAGFRPVQRDSLYRTVFLD